MSVKHLPDGGFGKISINVPVVAFDNTHDSVNNKDALNWYIRGGVNNSTLDAGESDLGGAVLLYVQDGYVETDIGTGF